MRRSPSSSSRVFVQELDEQVLVRLGAEDPLEDEVGLGVGEDGTHAWRVPRIPVGGDGGPALASAAAQKSVPECL